MIEIIIAALIGGSLGVGGSVAYARTRRATSKTTIEKELANAKQKASDIVLKAKDDAVSLENERRKEWKKQNLVWLIAKRRSTTSLTSLISVQKNCAAKKTR